MLNVMLLVALGGAAPAQPAADAPAPAHITVRLPADARLYMDGVLCPQN